jgi:hypothetical protein
VALALEEWNRWELVLDLEDDLAVAMVALDALVPSVFSVRLVEVESSLLRDLELELRFDIPTRVDFLGSVILSRRY